MANPCKYREISTILQERICSGTYAISGFPGERTLAAEFGVSHMTARKAVQELIHQGVLPRRPVGSIAKADRRLRSTDVSTYAFVCPAAESPIYLSWFRALKEVVRQNDGTVITIGYAGENDPILTDMLDGEFDGIFLIPPPKLPDLVQERLRQGQERVVTLFQDYTALGIPCIDNGSPRFIHLLAEHLYELGHSNVACLSTQEHDQLICERIAAWQTAANTQHMHSTLYDIPAQTGQSSDWLAYKESKRLLKDKDFQATAVFCTSGGTAKGMIRAAYELGLKIGEELSVCTCDTHEACQLNVPSITTLVNPDRSPLFQRALSWFENGGDRWKESLRIEQEHIPVWVGESTCAPRQKNKTGKPKSQQP